jgi:hypothetical protein
VVLVGRAFGLLPGWSAGVSIPALGRGGTRPACNIWRLTTHHMAWMVWLPAYKAEDGMGYCWVRSGLLPVYCIALCAGSFLISMPLGCSGMIVGWLCVQCGAGEPCEGSG